MTSLNLLGAQQPCAEEIAACGSGYLVGRRGSVMFSLTEVNQPTESYDAAEEMGSAQAERYPSGFLLMIIAKQGTPMPTPEARQRIGGMTRRLGPHLRGIALVFEGQGLWASSMRMVGNGMLLVLKPGFPQRMFGDIRSALDWFSDIYPTAPDFAENYEQLAGLSSRLEQCPNCPCARGQWVAE